MPIARIYASQVEEAEPICADLLARGYNVEVVFPDAVLPNPADLELRVERCSAEEAVARVEAAGSASRCVFMTPSKGPRRELLLVEMTVLATGTDGRHPMMPLTNVPLKAAAPRPLPVIETEQAEAAAPKDISLLPVEAAQSLAEVLPFPVPVPAIAAETTQNVVQAWPVSEGDSSFSKHLIFELNAFLAHTPAMEHPEGLYVKLFESVRQSVHVKRTRKNWEKLTLAGVAASLALLMLLGWYAGPGPSREVAKESANSVLRTAESGTAARVSAGTMLPKESLRAISLKTAAHGTLRDFSAGRGGMIRRDGRVESRMQDDVIARDQVTNLVQRSFSKVGPSRPSQLATTSELIQPAAIRPAPRSAPIKIITDLK